MEYLISAFTRCFYHFSHEVLTNSKSFKIGFYLDIVLTCYSFLRLPYIPLIVWWNGKSDPAVAYFCSVDPVMHILVSMDSITMLNFYLLFQLFQLYYKVLLSRIDLKTPVWQFWRQLIVSFQDHYYNCLLAEGELRKVHQTVEKEILKLISQKHPKMIALFACSLVQKNTVKFISQFLVWVRLQNVDQRQFFSYKGLLENASNSVKRRAILMMTAADRYITAMLVTIGKMLFLKFLQTCFKSIFISSAH